MKITTMNDIREGSVVRVNGRSVVVLGIEENGKNGKDVFDYERNGEGYWAYVSEISKVEAY